MPEQIRIILNTSYGLVLLITIILETFMEMYDRKETIKELFKMKRK